MSELTHERLKELLHYDPDTGIFTWKVHASSRACVGDVAGSFDSDGYIRIVIDGWEHRAHTLAWLYVHGERPSEIDHENEIKTDNRISNLRPCSTAQNRQNQFKPQSNNTSGFRGVDAHRGAWRSRIHIGGRRITLGHYLTPEEASEVYAIAKQVYAIAKQTHHPFWRGSDV